MLNAAELVVSSVQGKQHWAVEWRARQVWIDTFHTAGTNLQHTASQRISSNRSPRLVLQQKTILSDEIKKRRAKKLLHLFGFSTTVRLNGEYLPKETWHRESGKGVGKCEGSPTLFQNFLNFGLQTAQNRTGVFTHAHCFVLSQSIAHPLCGINVVPHSNSKWYGIGFVCSSDLKTQMLSCRAALSGNPSLSLPPFLVFFLFIPLFPRKSVSHAAHTIFTG